VVHEIAKRSQAPKQWGERCNYFLACNPCNCTVLEDATLPYQFAIKLLNDAKHYDRRRVNVLRGRAPDAISESDVMRALSEIAFYALSKHVGGQQALELRTVLQSASRPVSERPWLVEGGVPCQE
jgi:hypothetical protein